MYRLGLQTVPLPCISIIIIIIIIKHLIPSPIKNCWTRFIQLIVKGNLWDWFKYYLSESQNQLTVGYLLHFLLAPPSQYVVITVKGMHVPRGKSFAYHLCIVVPGEKFRGVALTLFQAKAIVMNIL